MASTTSLPGALASPGDGYKEALAKEDPALAKLRKVCIVSPLALVCCSDLLTSINSPRTIIPIKDFNEILAEIGPHAVQAQCLSRADFAKASEMTETEITSEVMEGAGDLNRDMRVDFMEYAKDVGATPEMLATCADNPDQVPFDFEGYVAPVEVLEAIPSMGCGIEMADGMPPDCKEDDVETASNEHKEEYIDIYKEPSEFPTTLIACCCVSTLIIALCIWGIVASSNYDTNPAENWPKGSCNVTSVKDTVRACLSCNTATAWCELSPYPTSPL